MGCGISTVSRRIFFTLNGEFLGPAFTAKSHHLPLYPVVGIDSFSPVKFNFGAEPFVFDLTVRPAAQPHLHLRPGKCIYIRPPQTVPEPLHISRRRSRMASCFAYFGPE